MTRHDDEIRIPARTARLALYSFVVLAILLVAYLVLYGLRRDDHPDVVIDESTLDFGDVAFNTPLKAEFTLRNRGDKPLSITGTQVVVRAGC